MGVTYMVLLHFSDVDLSEEAINEIEMHREEGQGECDAERKETQVICKRADPLSGVIELIVDFVNGYPVALPV